jgi:NTP pyrophosphatase (non-canonical NTP hydrolase)
MDIDDYQEIAHTTAVYPEEIGEIYCALGAAGEAGELANKVKKYFIRDASPGGLTSEQKKAVVQEVGDVFWYLVELLTNMNVRASEALFLNISVLASRQERDALHGSGDTR